MATIQGRKTDWLYNVGDLKVRALLNNEDEDAKKQNAGREAPVLLEDAIASNGAPFSHVIVVDPGSVIKLEIRSNGPVGFGYRVRTPAEPIAERLYCLKDSETDAEPITDVLRRYQRTNTLIRVDDWRSLGLDTPDDRAARWSLDVASWKVHGYLDDLKAIYFGTPRPVANPKPLAGETPRAVASARVIGGVTAGAISGSTAGVGIAGAGGRIGGGGQGATVVGGAVQAWPARFSSQELGTVSSVNEDERNNGYLTIHVFAIGDPRDRSQLFR